MVCGRVSKTSCLAIHPSNAPSSGGCILTNIRIPDVTLINPFIRDNDRARAVGQLGQLNREPLKPSSGAAFGAAHQGRRRSRRFNQTCLYAAAQGSTIEILRSAKCRTFRVASVARLASVIPAI
jgi:hypothetical protein